MMSVDKAIALTMHPQGLGNASGASFKVENAAKSTARVL